MPELKTYGGRWQVIDRIGRGGQGIVFRVADTKDIPTERQLVLQLKEALRATQPDINAVNPASDAFTPLIAAIRAISAPPYAGVAALKELLPFDDAVAADEATAVRRMRNEIAALSSVNHPALVKILDQNLDQRWFAMEFFANGPISRWPARFRGRALDALKAIRPVVDAVSELHKKTTVHRDIKPDNIFLADDGRLVLGDCGLAFKLEAQDRLTLSFENVGTREYQPPWTYGMRVEDVKPNFDVFGLSKVMWAMISGKPRFPLEDFDRPPHDLRVMFPNDDGILFVHRILGKCVVRREEDCAISNAGALLTEIDSAIGALSAGAVVPRRRDEMRCRFCGVGSYAKADEFDVSGNEKAGLPREYYCCKNCGHLEFFVHLNGQMPPAWNEQ
jgi:serine/threonine protein kinase